MQNEGFLHNLFFWFLCACVMRRLLIWLSCCDMRYYSVNTYDLHLVPTTYLSFEFWRELSLVGIPIMPLTSLLNHNSIDKETTVWLSCCDMRYYSVNIPDLYLVSMSLGNLMAQLYYRNKSLQGHIRLTLSCIGENIDQAWNKQCSIPLL
jgi:hypothetical protein